MFAGSVDWTVVLAGLVLPVSVSLVLLWLLWRMTR